MDGPASKVNPAERVLVEVLAHPPSYTLSIAKSSERIHRRRDFLVGSGGVVLLAVGAGLGLFDPRARALAGCDGWWTW